MADGSGRIHRDSGVWEVVVLQGAMLPESAKAAGALVVTIDPQPRSGCWLEGNARTVLPDLIHDAY